MSSRALRRARQDDLAAMAAASEESDASDEQPQRTFNAFDLLDLVDEPLDDQDNSVDNDDQLAEEVKEEQEDTHKEATPVNNKPVQKRRGKNKRNKNKKQPNARVDPVELPEQPPQLILESTRRLCKLLAVSKKDCNPEAEIKRLFGTSAVRSVQQHQQSRGPAPRLLARFILASPPNDGVYWPELPRIGLDMKKLAEVNGIAYFQFTHSKEYAELEERYFELTGTMNPQFVQQFMVAHPSHSATLVLLAFVAVQTGDLTSANDLLARAFVTFEKSFSTEFQLLLTEPLGVGKTVFDSLGTHRLLYDSYTNRSFFLALFLHIVLLQRRGCWRTALEVCKILLRIEPKSDPLASLLLLDFLALRAEQNDFVIEFYELCENRVNWFVNWRYSVALAHFLAELNSRNSKNLDMSQDMVDEHHKKSSEFLEEAIVCFPWAVERLMVKNNFAPDEYLVHDSPSESVSLLIDLYVSRSHSFWKRPEVVQWLKLVYPAAHKRYLDAKAGHGLEKDRHFVTKLKTLNSSYFLNLPLSVYRHIFLTDWAGSNTQTASTEQLAKFIPKKFVSGPTSLLPWGSSHMTISDPFPPNVAMYDITLDGKPLIESPIAPYENYFKRSLLLKHPYQVLPILLSAARDQNKSADAIMYELQVPVYALPADLQPLLESAAREGVLGGFTSFIQSLLPWRSVSSAVADGDIEKVPGLKEFLSK